MPLSKTQQDLLDTMAEAIMMEAQRFIASRWHFVPGNPFEIHNDVGLVVLRIEPTHGFNTTALLLEYIVGQHNDAFDATQEMNS